MVRLSVSYCLRRKEIAVLFPDPAAATQYQQINHEGRIYRENTRTVYLPVWDSMPSFSSSTYSAWPFVVSFDFKDNAQKWSNIVKISAPNSLRLSVTDCSYGLQFEHAKLTAVISSNNINIYY